MQRAGRDLLRRAAGGADRDLERRRARRRRRAAARRRPAADDLLLRLQKLSPTLGFAAGERASGPAQWMADPFTQDALLVQQCVVRLLFALRAMAEARAAR